MRVSVRKLAVMAVLTAIALIVFVIESQIPVPLPVPGAKLGLANAVTLFALFYDNGKGRGVDKERGAERSKGRDAEKLTVANVLMILICRIILGAAFSGRIIALIYSISGGMLSFTVQAVMKRFITHKQIWACGAAGAVFHNIGQIIAAMLVTGTSAIAAYLPVLTIVGVITGIITGLIAQFTIERLRLQR